MEAYIFREKAPLAAVLPPGQLVKASELWSRCLNTLWARIYSVCQFTQFGQPLFRYLYPRKSVPRRTDLSNDYNRVLYVGKVQPEAHRHFVVRRLFLVRMYASWLFFKGQLTDIRCSFSLVTFMYLVGCVLWVGRSCCSAACVSFCISD